MKIYVTKYALTQGIQEFESQATSAAAGMVRVQSCGKPGHVDQFFHGEGREWHRTPEAARLRADALRDAKIASLKKQIAKLEGMEF